MPSLRKRVTSYIRQLSFHNEPREKRQNINENTFVTKYLQGQIKLRDGPPVLSGKAPTDLPNYDLAIYTMGADSIIGCYTGPNGGLTTVKRTEKHLSIPDADIDFIDTQEEIVSATSTTSESGVPQINDHLLPEEWLKHSDYIYGLSDSLYDRNQVTKMKNGDPIADCFGIVARRDSAILAVADGVNWGEKACIAAKSAIHGCLHYLNKTIFNDLKPFENLIKGDSKDIKCETPLHETHITNTQEVFVCLLRAFNCAHDLILENNGMLTTLTVAVILPLKQSSVTRTSENVKTNENDTYVCCVCNVGDTLAYVYSNKYGIRELTKGSHDIQSNRDMRDALGALGPVDGTNPELSNLTLSLTKIQKGDIIVLASDGLTDNFDPNVCKFTANSNVISELKTKRQTNIKPNEPQKSQKAEIPKPKNEEFKKPPVKPPRRHPKGKDNTSRSSTDRSTRSGSEDSVNSNLGNLKKSSIDTVDNVLSHGRFSSIEEKPKTDLVNSNSPQKTKLALTSTVEIVNNINFQSQSTQINNNKLDSNERICGISEDSNSNNPNSQSTSNRSDKAPSKSEVSNKSESGADPTLNNPLIAQFLRENSLDQDNSLEKCKISVSEPKPIRNFPSSQKTLPPSSQNFQHQQLTRRTLEPINKGKDIRKSMEGKSDAPKYNFLRSKTSLDLRVKPIHRNEDGIPFVSPIQRYELTLLLMEDILQHGISGRDPQCVTAKKLCENLMRFTFSITAAKRRTLEDNDLYFDNQNGLMVEVSPHEKKIRRKKGLEKVQNLPGKLDHVTVVAFNVGNFAILP